jgi:hypothetical protein
MRFGSGRLKKLVSSMKDIGGKMVEMTGPQRGEEWVNVRIGRMQTGQMDDLLERSALNRFHATKSNNRERTHESSSEQGPYHASR